MAGDPVRAAMLHALMDGRSLTAGELALVGGVTPQTASGHLARLLEAGFLALERQGRHRYYRLASPILARMVESMMHVASVLAEPARRIHTGPKDIALRTARTCYDHLAGRLGVAISDAMIASGHAVIDSDGGEITEKGLVHLASVGIGLETGTAARGRRRGVLCRPCLDWSERRVHLAGRVGSALCRHAFAQDWIRRIDGSRAVLITPRGRAGFKQAFGVELTTAHGQEGSALACVAKDGKSRSRQGARTDPLEQGPVDYPPIAAHRTEPGSARNE